MRKNKGYDEEMDRSPVPSLATLRLCTGAPAWLSDTTTTVPSPLTAVLVCAAWSFRQIPPRFDADVVHTKRRYYCRRFLRRQDLRHDVDREPGQREAVFKPGKCFAGMPDPSHVADHILGQPMLSVQGSVFLAGIGYTATGL